MHLLQVHNFMIIWYLLTQLHFKEKQLGFKVKMANGHSIHLASLQNPPKIKTIVEGEF